jgi:type 1 glutamine amidotransferase
LKLDVEQRTDHASLGPWRALGDSAAARLQQLVRPWADQLVDAGVGGCWHEHDRLWSETESMTKTPRPLLRRGLKPPRRTRVALVTRGRPFDKGALFALFDSINAIDWMHVEHPEAQQLFHPRRASEIDCFVLYDLPGIVFDPDAPPRYPTPPEAYVAGMHRLLADGKGMVFLHQAIAGWPAWAEYGEIIGGRFLYSSAVLRGRRFPDSGYRHDVTHRVHVERPDHPVCEGLPSSFELTDEVFLYTTFDGSLTPLLRSAHEFVDRNFWSSARAVAGFRYDREGWSHPQGSDLIGWVKSYTNSPIVYLQPGDGATTYADANYRRMLTNAMRWAGSDEALRWAQEPLAG